MRERRPNRWAVLPAVALAANTVRAQDQTLYVSSAMANSAAARHTCVQNPEIAMYAPVCDLNQRDTILRIGSTTAAAAAGCPAVFNALFSGSHSLPYNTICDCIAATDRRRGGDCWTCVAAHTPPTKLLSCNTPSSAVRLCWSASCAHPHLTLAACFSARCAMLVLDACIIKWCHLRKFPRFTARGWNMQPIFGVRDVQLRRRFLPHLSSVPWILQRSLRLLLVYAT
eukprot:COSAG01_NODE_4767_length_4755_cov_1.948883_2_plen_227_part_00